MSYEFSNLYNSAKVLSWSSGATKLMACGCPASNSIIWWSSKLFCYFFSLIGLEWSTLVGTVLISSLTSFSDIGLLAFLKSSWREKLGVSSLRWMIYSLKSFRWTTGTLEVRSILNFGHWFMRSYHISLRFNPSSFKISSALSITSKISFSLKNSMILSL